MKKFPFLAALLLMAETAITLSDGKFAADESQLDTIEGALKEASENKTKLTAAEASIQAKDQEIATLKAQIEELNKQPGDSTTHPVNDGGGKNDSPMDAFIERMNAAQKLYDMV